jgi:hypothetical protein
MQALYKPTEREVKKKKKQEDTERKYIGTA